jgi:hypothetical protein
MRSTRIPYSFPLPVKQFRSPGITKIAPPLQVLPRFAACLCALCNESTVSEPRSGTKVLRDVAKDYCLMRCLKQTSIEPA